MSRILEVAVPGPFRTPLDYLAPDDRPVPAAGSRVSVPLGPRRVVGVVMADRSRSAVPAGRLRSIHAVLDPEPLLDADILHLARWAADYYHHPIGEVLTRCLPPKRRRVESGRRPPPKAWQTTALGRDMNPASLRRTPARARALTILQQASAALDADHLATLGVRRSILRKLEADGLARAVDAPAESPPLDTQTAVWADRFEPNPDQAAAIAAILDGLQSFQVFLLDGITGSGKTEVYLHAMAATLAAGRQALLLVPEIGLTPQTEQRLRERFGDAVAMLHSGMADGARLAHWDRARRGSARILIGTRSAVFTPLPDLGLIVVDEEHDASYKQQDGLRYSARDLALVRARDRAIPVVLGSATPSLESLHNAQSGRYRHLRLLRRAGAARPPAIELVDLRRHPSEDGLSMPVRTAIAEALDAGGQVLAFINRRGFAPVLHCSDCGWIAECQRCDARMTVHSRPGELRCHHCGASRPLPPRCPACAAPEPMPMGQGTQRTESALTGAFAPVPVIRIDRDTTSSGQALDAAFDRIQSGEPAILVGTQMLAKGHHFPAVTLAVVLDADGGLFSADFRAGERLAQLVLQVAGRAGRAERPGRVLIQTRQPDHPLWADLLGPGGYAAFAESALAERRETSLPPCSHLALLRAEAARRQDAWTFLERCAEHLEGQESVSVLGPVAALRERIAGRFRAQILLQSTHRGPLHRLLRRILPTIEALPEARRTRWTLDVDPLDLF